MIFLKIVNPVKCDPFCDENISQTCTFLHNVRLLHVSAGATYNMQQNPK